MDWNDGISEWTSKHSKSIAQWIIKKGKLNNMGFFKFLINLGPWLVLIIVFGFSVLFVPRFLAERNVMNILAQTGIYIPMTIGMCYVITGGGIDLSVGSQVALIGVVASQIAYQTATPAWIIIIFALAMGAGLGFVNGFVIAKIRLPDFIVTLAFMEIYRGLALVHSAGFIWHGLPSDLRYLGHVRWFGALPVSVVVGFILTGLAAWAYHYTFFGRYTIAIGGAKDTSQVVGIPIAKYKIFQYMFMGAMCGLSSILLVGRIDSAQATMGEGYEIHVIAATIMGGTALAGGKGSVWGALIGAIILAIIANIMVLIGLPFFWRLVGTGVVVLIAVLINQLREQLVYTV